MRVWRVLLLLAAISVAAIAVLSGRGSKEAEGSVRNVILISIDTLRADHLGCYGYPLPTSPKIDAFASRGALFKKAISASGWTVPSHMTMFTGLDPLDHQAEGYPDPAKLSRRVETVAEILGRNRIRTAAFVGGGYLWPKSGFKRGFQKYSSNGRHFTNNIASTREWIRDHNDERFFLFFHGYDVHRPYTPSPANARLFAGDYKGNFKIEDLAPNKPRPSEEDLRFAISQYDAEIRDVDDLLGGLLSEWEQMGLLEKTLVIIVSDHGDEFYEHGQVYHAHSLYDELLHVPLIMVGPGVVSAVHTEQVGLIDVTPTILSAMGFGSESGGMRGIDLMPVARGERDAPERLLYSSLRFSAYPYSITALRGEDWKLIAWDIAGMRGRHIPNSRQEYSYKFRRDREENFDELFDLRQDPGEQRDVAAENVATRNQLLAELEPYLRAKPGAPGVKRKSQPNLSPKELEDLKALGYLNDQP
jgi:arylsulfatase A-like enzyme